MTQFRDLHKGRQDQAARAGLARFLIHRLGTVNQVAADGRAVLATEVATALHKGLAKADPSFKASSVSRWAGYCRGVWHHDEDVSNRHWAELPSDVQDVATGIVDYVEANAFS